MHSRLIKKFSLYLICLACFVPTYTIAAEQAGVEHIVLLWLKQPGNQQHRQQLIDASKTLKAIALIEQLKIGAVLHSDRAIVDDSFDLGLIMTFTSSANMQQYLQHPLHISIVKEKIKPLVAKIVVYDFLLLK